MYGLGFNSDFLFASASTGFSVSWGDYAYPASGRTFLSPGIPFEVQAFVNPLPIFALGGKLTGDLNHTSSFSTVMLCLRMGFLRYTK